MQPTDRNANNDLIERDIKDLIERYLNEVGRHLPQKSRKDILGEMRSALADALEGQAGDNPTRAQTIEMLKAFGEPRKVASRYYPEGQYLIGPTLYPLFRLVSGIALAAVLGAQVIAWLTAAFFAGAPFSAVDAAAGMINSLPSTLGWVLIVFIILQRFDVRPDEDDKAWDPADLPAVDTHEEVKRADRVAAIIAQAVVLVVLAGFSDKLGVYVFPGGTFFPNNLLGPFIPWFSLSLLLGIGLDIYLLWQGRWTILSRAAKLASNLFGIVLLALLTQVHFAWLQAHGITSFTAGIEAMAQNPLAGTEIIMVQSFLLGFGIALIVTVIETVVEAWRLVMKLIEK